MKDKVKKPKKPRMSKRQAHAQEVLAGLRIGKRYRRAYSIEAGTITGTESLEPSGSGPVFSRVRHTIVPTEGGGAARIHDDELADMIETDGGRWTKF